MTVGPRNITYGLVFGYDVGSDVSYLGEPTTNLIPDAANNGRFTTSNSWATYNTNQYCGNNGCGTYWTIPSISSVSSNIVTTSSAHQIRSFDVIQPNATGGGVNNGQNYVAKKISDTQFCLYPYNGSQSGADGYINPTTGFYKVHDDYANDNKVSINASGFPTGWWGAPHLPNSGLIKEIVSGGGRVPGTNCMRWHVYRGDGVADGMAYGVYTPVTAGDTITVSYYLRAATKSAVGKGGSYTTYFYGYGAFSAGFSWGAQGEWVRNVHQWTASYTSSFYQYWFPDGSGDPYSVDIADLQVEVNRGHATKFTTGTRNGTNGLKDMSSNNNSIDISNLTFDSSGNPYFDGSNDYIPLTVGTIPTNQVTFEFICNNTASSNNTSIIAGGASGNQDLNIHLPWGDGNVYWDFGRPFNRIYKATNSSERTGTHHWVFTKNPTTGIMNIYLDGALWHTGGGNTSTLPTMSIASLGRYVNGNYTGYYYSGSIPVCKIYNRELSAIEVAQHYISYKTRFSLP